jgi:hypothetical protein
MHASNGTWCHGSSLDFSDLIEAALATQPITPVPSAPDWRKLFTVIKGAANSGPLAGTELERVVLKEI